MDALFAAEGADFLIPAAAETGETHENNPARRQKHSFNVLESRLHPLLHKSQECCQHPTKDERIPSFAGSILSVLFLD
ncbi:hypothetical protein [Faecalispora sporosphaeroides]|uniref:hypothetical protein n=1 Tax=Faecalispora sporosphaeroides TaxID=1549 RepID=UPI0003A5907A|nr:hypothetical protein [Faecalispora sporosphaeroides]